MRIFALLSILLISCSLTTPLEIKPVELSINDENVIAFVALNISQDSIHNTNVIDVLSQTITNGKIKGDFNIRIQSENYLTIDQFQDGKLVKTTFIEHPLFKRIEYSDENGFKTKNVELDSAEFFIRLQIKSGSTKISISETLVKGISRELITIKL